MSLKQLIDDITKETGYELNNGEVSYHCPVCHHAKRKLQVNLVTHKWGCWVCGESHGTRGGSLKTLFGVYKANEGYYQKLQEFGYSPHKKVIVSDDLKHRRIQLPSEFKSLIVHNKSLEYKHAVAYLRRRNISKQDIIKYNIGFCVEGEYKDRLIFPSYDHNGSLNYFTSRVWVDASYSSYKKPPFSSHDVIGYEFFVNWDFPVVLCEGVFDAIAIKRNAIPLFGKVIGPCVKEKILTHKPDVYLVYDNDAFHTLIRSCEQLLTYGVRIFPVRLTEKDPAEMGYKNIHALLNNTQQLTFSELVKMKLSI